jgi:hypothetical protein
MITEVLLIVFFAVFEIVVMHLISIAALLRRVY